MEFMRLSKLDKSGIINKNIFFVGFTASNIKYFLECFPDCADRICGVFALLTIDERTQLTVDVGERAFELRNIVEALSLDFENDILIVMYEYENEAFEKLKNIGLPEAFRLYWFADEATEMELMYREQYAKEDLQNIILFRSGPRKFVFGDDFNDNSKALFKHMIENDYNKKWTLVWLVFEPESTDYDYWKEFDNVEFVGVTDKSSLDRKKRDLYYRYICLAKYAFVTDDELFFQRRRDDQTIVQLWHGDGVKARTRHRRMEDRWEYMVCTSNFFADVNYIDFGLRKDQTLPCGCPKDDWVLTNRLDPSEYLESEHQFGHYILWAPTFRKTIKGLELLNEKIKINETGFPLLATWEECNYLNEQLREQDCLLVIKLHPIADLSLYSKKTFSNIRLVTNQDLYLLGYHINEIMSGFDALITDYSSVTTSYMILDRPMAFTLDDFNEYNDSRGFVLNPVRDYLPGKELYTIGDMIGFIIEVCNCEDTLMDKRKRLIDTMLDYRDNNSSKRLLDRLGITP